ncbi:F-box/kelch-repeat protein At3g24760-like [Arachis hypogaea]|uniref:F-box/kelch-repeat protein At3g24760-like n=1 Tax=Arachis hypogaea TaxID=3818 RepID=UPI000DEC2968|nr:F-box/kelch-repeat protein At3g24760-like [Arachis hypogaea]
MESITSPQRTTSPSPLTQPPILGSSSQPSHENLVDIEDRLDVEIYDPVQGTWELSPPLPADFRSGNSSSSLSSAMFKGRFYVYGIYSCFVASFDLKQRIWSDVQTLRPHLGVAFCFLIPCSKHLLLAGVCNSPQGGCSFNLWKVDEGTMEVSEIGAMPRELLYALFDGDEDDEFASLKCVGLDDLVYVFNEDYRSVYPSCVCEIDADSGRCSWRRVPQLPSPVNKFHKVISFCSTLSLHSILGDEDEHLQIQ